MAEFRKEEQYIIDESPEISLGERGRWTSKFFSIFPALSSRNYQLYFVGQLISNIGTWLQMVALGWLVLTLTNSAFFVGLVAAASSLPTLLFSLFGGVIVDRFSKRKVIIITQTTAMTLAFILGVLTITGMINVWEIVVLAFMLGCVHAIDWPARQAFVVEMVGKEKMASAIAMNSGLFNGARVIGPSLAGFMIAIVGTGGAFILNGFSFIAVITALFAIKVQSLAAKTHPDPLRAVREGINYSARHPVIKILLLFAGVTSIFGWSYATILPVIARNTYHQGAAGLGYLYAFSGLGALCATILVSALSKKARPALFILGGNSLFAFSVILLSFVKNIYAAYPLLFLAGFGILCQFTMINSTIQGMVKDKYRGRVMSIYSIMFLGMGPIGNMQVGYVSEHWGTAFALRLGATITLLFGILVYFNRKRVLAQYREYKKEML